MGTTLAELASVVGARTTGSAAIRDLAYDTRALTAGSLFFCIPGHRVDGHELASDAVARGATALVVERALDVKVPQMIVESVRAAMGPIAAAFFDHPSRALSLVGVTGTNGKTTSVWMLENVFRQAGMKPGLISNIERHIGDEIVPVDRNTPESIDLQRLLARMRDAGVRAAAMEVTSEGIAEGRVEGTHYSCAVFTNLTQDHLNYHGTMENYFQAKALLFRSDMAERAVVNVDDTYGCRLVEMLDIPCTTFAIDAPADVRARDITSDARGSRFVADAGGETTDVDVKIPARHNVANALGVIATANALGISLRHAAAGIAATLGVAGRLEAIDAGQDFTVLVDYAHTPDSLENVLRAARDFTPAGARLVVVFGCGGDRDRGKRPLMGRIGVDLADRAIITSDNPRSEDPRAIISEIETGARDAGKPYDVEPDRRAAIQMAIADARTGDVIVIAGKGHESGQEFADHTIPFDDRSVARDALGATARP
ncbi:MAG: UDP-N-acetylmuramoyl-L-alanyl-D-glutamate--2,6-diaminopimelate ligase [Actinomycetota bacterium]